MQEAVIATCPDDTRFLGGFGNGEDIGVVFHASVVLRNRAAGGLERFRLAPGEVGADDLPGLPFVIADVQVVGAGVQLVPVVWAKEDGVVPVEAVFHDLYTGTGRVVGPDVGTALLASLVVQAAHIAFVGTCIDDIRVVGVWGEMGAFTPGGNIPVFFGDIASGAAV